MMFDRRLISKMIQEIQEDEGLFPDLRTFIEKRYYTTVDVKVYEKWSITPKYRFRINADRFVTLDKIVKSIEGILESLKSNGIIIKDYEVTEDDGWGE